MSGDIQSNGSSAIAGRGFLCPQSIVTILDQSDVFHGGVESAVVT